MKKETPPRKQKGTRSSGGEADGASPNGYHNGILKMPLPKKPVKGAGYERLRWRKDGKLRDHDKPEERFSQKIESGLQRWFYDLLPETHRTKQREDFWVSQEAWRMFIDHLGFWSEEYGKVKALRAAEAAKKRKKAAIERQSADKKIAEAAVRAGFKKSELKLKLSRLKGLMKNGDLTMAAALFEASEPWLLDAVLAGASIEVVQNHACFSVKTKIGSTVLAGASIEVVQDQWQAHRLEFQTGSFFADCDDSDLGFWVAVASAAAAGCCPASIALEDVYDLDLRLGNVAQMELATRLVLPALPSLQQLTLKVPFGRFSTSTLPPMPRLSRLIIEAHDVLVQSLEKQFSLEALRLRSLDQPLKLEIDDDQCVTFNRVRLEIDAGSYSYDQSGLLDISGPPEMGGDVQQLNTPALSILLSMQRNHSGDATPPEWWRERWIAPDVLSRATGQVKDRKKGAITVVDVSGQEHIHDYPLGHLPCLHDSVTQGDVLACRQPRLLDLTALGNLSATQAELIAKSGAAVRVCASCLDVETSQLLATTSGDLHVHMNDGQAAGLVELMQVRGGLFLHFEEDVQGDAARVLSRFRGETLGVRCRDLKAPFLQQLAGFPGELRLESLWPQVVLEIGVKEAKLLVERKGRVVFRGHFAFSPEALAILAMRADWDLRAYRRVFRKSGKQGERTVTLERLHRNDGVWRSKPHYLRVTRKSQNGQKKITDKFTMNATNQDFRTYLEVAASELLQAGWEEIQFSHLPQPPP